MSPDRARQHPFVPTPSEILRRWLFYSAISAAVGVGISLMLTTAYGASASWQELLAGAVIGVSINTTIMAFERLIVIPIERRTSLSPFWIRVPNYVVGGMVGFVLGNRLGSVLVPDTFLIPTAALRTWMPLMGLFAVVVGMLIYGYEHMRGRLESSVAELKEREFAQKELELARSIQERLLPPRAVRGEGFSVAARNVAAAYVAGDYFDIFRFGNGDLGLVVADVAGKGMGASLIMASAKAMLPFIAAERTIAESLMMLNERLVADLGRREFVAVAFARFSPSSGRLEIGNAGLPDPYRISTKGVEALEVVGPRLPLGARRDVVYQSSTWTLEPGERVVLFSDGLPEALDESGAPLGYERLEALLGLQSGAPEAWLDGLFSSLRGESDGPPTDDWTALLLERLA